MTEVVRKGIQEAELQLQKDNQDKLMEEVCVCAYFCMCMTLINALYTCTFYGLICIKNIHHHLSLSLSGCVETDSSGRLCVELVLSVPEHCEGQNL